MASDSWFKRLLMGKEPRSPRGLVEDCVVICVSTPGIWRHLRISMIATLLRPMVFRHWFECPLCRRCSFKLYLPPGAAVYACRRCHHLTYTSSLKRTKDGLPRKRSLSRPSDRN